MNIEDIKREVVLACTEFEVQRLFIFGSFARGTESSTSDVDFLVEFKFPENSLAKRYFGLLCGLEDTLERSIDLLTSQSLRNAHFRKRVMEESVLIYAK